MHVFNHMHFGNGFGGRYVLSNPNLLLAVSCVSRYVLNITFVSVVLRTNDVFHSRCNRCKVMENSCACIFPSQNTCYSSGGWRS